MHKTFLLIAAALTAVTALRAQPVTPEHEACARELVGRMTLEEKIDYIGGYNTFFIRSVPRLGIPEIRMADGRRACATISAPSSSAVTRKARSIRAAWPPLRPGTASSCARWGAVSDRTRVPAGCTSCWGPV